MTGGVPEWFVKLKETYAEEPDDLAVISEVETRWRAWRAETNKRVARQKRIEAKRRRDSTPEAVVKRAIDAGLPVRSYTIDGVTYNLRQPVESTDEATMTELDLWRAKRRGQG